MSQKLGPALSLALLLTVSCARLFGDLPHSADPDNPDADTDADIDPDEDADSEAGSDSGSDADLERDGDDLVGDPLLFDVAAGLEANIIDGAGDGLDAPQRGADGWWFHYHVITGFYRRGPLSAGEMAPEVYRLMERARDDSHRTGWYGTAGDVAVGERGTVSLLLWGEGLVNEGGDALWIDVENSRQVVIEWRSPGRGVAEASFEVAMRSDELSDMEWHLFAVVGGSSVELDWAYLSSDGGPDAQDVSTVEATHERPFALSGRSAVEAGDSLFLYVRVGDDDAYDGGALRGQVTFWELE